MERRNFFKLFGAGVAVVPIIGGLPKIEAESVLVAPPKLVLPDPVEFSSPLGGFDAYEIVLFGRNRRTGATFRMECDRSFITKWRHNLIDVTMATDKEKKFLPGLVDLTVELSGKIV